jgi:membrane protein required for colicin V production
MNLVDIALAILLLICAVRGFWRGLIRESFGFAAFVAGLGVALRMADAVGQSLEGVDLLASLPDAARVGGAFVAIFLVVSAVLNLVGFVLDRLVGGGSLRQVGKVAGGLFGVAKGAAVLAFVLLFFQLFPFVRGLDQQLAQSRLARPMISAAGNFLRGNWTGKGTAGEAA